MLAKVSVPSEYSLATTKSVSPSTGVPYHFFPPSTLINRPSFVAAYQALSVIWMERTRGAIATGIGTSTGSFFAVLLAGVFRALLADVPFFFALVLVFAGAGGGSGLGCHSGTGP